MVSFPIIQPNLSTHSFYWDLLDKLGLEFNSPMHRLCSLMRKMGAGSYIVEAIPLKNDLQEEINELNVYYGSKGRGKAYRIAFFNRSLDHLSFKKIPQDSCIACVTVILYSNKSDKLKEELNYIYEGYVSFPKEPETKEGLLNNYYHTGRKFRNVNMLDRPFTISGTFFCQQNGYTNVCAHSALKIIINSHNNSDPILTSAEINKLLGIDHKKRKASTGLAKKDLDSVLMNYGLRAAFSGNFFDRPEINVCQYLYSVVEGGYPAILIYATHTDYHAIPVLGHTLNTDQWFPEANFGYIGPDNYEQNNNSDNFRFHPSSTWVDHFLVHDDNFGMYLCLSSGCLKKVTLPSYDPKMRAYSIVGLYPSGIETSPGVIEQDGAFLIRKVIQQIYKSSKLEWGQKLYQVCSTRSNENLVLRTLLIDRETYYSWIKDCNDHKGNKISDDLLDNISQLPEQFWMTEYTLPNLYCANHTKLGEALFYVEESDVINEDDRLDKMMAAFRGPGVFLLRSNGDASGFYEISDTIQNHVDLLRNEPILKSRDW